MAFEIATAVATPRRLPVGQHLSENPVGSDLAGDGGGGAGVVTGDHGDFQAHGLELGDRGNQVVLDRVSWGRTLRLRCVVVLHPRILSRRRFLTDLIAPRPGPAVAEDEG